jgi:hypothetical protein
MNFTDYINNFAIKNQVFCAGGIPWRTYKGILQPLSHPHIEPIFKKGEIKRILKESKAPFAMWTYDFDTGESEWWWIIAQKPYSIDLLKKKDRYYIRYGLKNCEVKTITATWLADNGYDCYLSSINRHIQTEPLDKKAFKERMPNYDKNKAYQIWGVFWESKLVGYSIYIIIDDIVYQDDAMFDPDYFKYASSYALIHVTSDYYLNVQKNSYITTGMRSISHETEYQEFVIKHFNFRKSYCKLGLKYSSSFAIVAKIIYLLKPLWYKIYLPNNIKHKLNIIYKLSKIHQQQ